MKPIAKINQILESDSNRYVCAGAAGENAPHIRFEMNVHRSMSPYTTIRISCSGNFMWLAGFMRLWLFFGFDFIFADFAHCAPLYPVYVYTRDAEPFIPLVVVAGAEQIVAADNITCTNLFVVVVKRGLAFTPRFFSPC